MTRIVTLGDSITLGMGDPDPSGGWRGWARHLATGLPDPELHNLAVLGAQAKHVERDQLPAALQLRPDVASVVVGINDTLRAGFDPVGTGQAAARTVAALQAGGATVLTMRLPDPARMFGLPAGLARPLSRRMHAVNTELDKVAARYGTLHWDAARDPETYERRNWSVDRLHPNERGHRLIACRLWDSLAAAGHAVAARPDPEPADPGPTRRDDFLWMATKGTKWFLRRSVDLIPYLLFMAAREALTAPRDWASAASATPVVPVVSGAAGVAGVVGAVGVVGAGWLPGIDETPEPVTE
ncbi:SGNH/GDSL hydrolase family protein [Trebonia sp.]|uniref:SGNH/GDSL hydrolase family protein n=2 Tax=Trebonia sp. TaxID=2767075 RepID=UPI003C730961